MVLIRLSPFQGVDLFTHNRVELKKLQIPLEDDALNKMLKQILETKLHLFGASHAQCCSDFKHVAIMLKKRNHKVFLFNSANREREMKNPAHIERC